MRRNLVLILGLISMALLCLFCLRCHGPRIQEDLTRAGRQSLTQAGFDPQILEVSGRDATLVGSVSADHDKATAARLVGAIPGIRGVDNRLSIGARSTAGSRNGSGQSRETTEEAAGASDGPGDESVIASERSRLTAGANSAAEARFSLTRQGDRLVLTGVVPTESHRDSLVVRSKEIWGAENVSDEIGIDPAASAPDWLHGLPDALGWIAERTENGSLTISEDRLSLSGRVFAETAKEDFLRRLKTRLPGLVVEDRLEVRPPESIAELQGSLDTAILQRTVEFETNSAELTTVGRTVLDEIFELLSGQRTVPIAISGHTDSLGDPAYNLDLSRRRAESARDYLVELGLARDQFETSGLGKTRPIADNATREGRQKNRRIEFQAQEESK